jgi:hypothetical protein
MDATCAIPTKNPSLIVVFSFVDCFRSHHHKINAKDIVANDNKTAELKLASKKISAIPKITIVGMLDTNTISKNSRFFVLLFNIRSFDPQMSLHISGRKNTNIAKNVPMFKKISNECRWFGKPTIFEKTARCADELTGRNSVIPCIIPRHIASHKVMDHLAPCTMKHSCR